MTADLGRLETGASVEDEDDEELRRVGMGVRIWRRTRDRIDALAAKRYPQTNPDRRRSLAARDLFALGFAAEEAGYEPGDTIPKKRTR